MKMQMLKNEKTARILYICLAVLIVTVMVISVVASINKRRKPPVQTDPITTTEQQQQQPPEDTTRPHEERPIETVPPVVTAPPETEPPTRPVVVTDPPEEAPVIVKRVYIAPATGDVIKDYSADLPVYSTTMNDYRTHNGVDIASELGNPVFAFTDGTIENVYSDPMMGTTVIIDHGEGLKSVYQNLQSAILDGITAGKKVASGEVIGAVGETALIECAENTHLHFAVMKDGKFVSPIEYLATLTTAGNAE